MGTSLNLDSADIDQLTDALKNRLGKLDSDRRFLLLIDGVNQLGGGHDLRWLPTDLGPGVRVIISTIESSSVTVNSPEGIVLSALTGRVPEPRRLLLPPLTADDVRSIVVEYLREYCKELDSEHIARISDMTQARNPLYLRVMLAELRSLGGNDMNRHVPELIASMDRRHPDTASLFQWVLERVEVFGVETTALWCRYLAVSRGGMASRELADLLSRRMGPGADRQARRIERALRRYLLHRGEQLDFFHGQLLEAVLRRYADEMIPAEIGDTALHGDIAAYFTERWPTSDLHALGELPYHLLQAGSVAAVGKLLSDLEFMDRKVIALGPRRLADDYEMVLTENQDTDERKLLACLLGSLRLAAPALVGDPTQLPAQLLGRLIGQGSERIRSLLAAVQARFDASEGHLRPLVASLTPPGEVLLSIKTNYYEGLAFDGAGKRAVVGTVSGSVQVWDLSSGARLAELHLDGDRAQAIVCLADGMFLAASRDGRFHVLDIDRSAVVASFRKEDHEVSGLAVSPDGQLVLSTSGKEYIIWRTVDWRPVVERTIPHDQMFSPHDMRCTLTADGRVLLHDSTRCILMDPTLDEPGSYLRDEIEPLIKVSAEEKKRKAREEGYQHHEIKIDGKSMMTTMKRWRCVAGSHDGRALAVSVVDGGEMRLWDIERRKVIQLFLGHESEVASVTLNDDASKLLSAAKDGTLRLWEVQTGRELRVFTGLPSGVDKVAFLPDGGHGMSLTYGELKLWDLEGASEPRNPNHQRQVTSLAVTRRGDKAVSASKDGDLRIWSTATGGALGVLKGHTLPVLAVSITPDGRQAVSGSSDKSIRVWNLESREETAKLEGHEGSVNIIHLLRDGTRLISGDGDGKLIVWDLHERRPLFSLDGHEDVIVSMATSRNGERAVTSSRDQTVRIWDLESGQELHALEGNKRTVKSVAIAPDGRLVALAGDRIEIRILDIESGECVLELEGHGNAPGGVIYRNSDAELHSAAADGVRCWDLDADPLDETDTSPDLDAPGTDWIPAFKGYYVPMEAKHLGKPPPDPEHRLLPLSTGQFGWPKGARTIATWEVGSQHSIGRFTCDADLSVECVTPDGKTIITGDKTGRLHFLEVTDRTRQRSPDGDGVAHGDSLDYETRNTAEIDSQLQRVSSEYLRILQSDQGFEIDKSLSSRLTCRGALVELEGMVGELDTPRSRLLEQIDRDLADREAGRTFQSSRSPIARMKHADLKPRRILQRIEPARAKAPRKMADPVSRPDFQSLHRNRNNEAVELMRAGKVEQASDILRSILFVKGAVTMRRGLPPEIRANFITSLALDQNTEAAQHWLANEDLTAHPRLAELGSALTLWREGLSWSQKLGVRKKPLLELPFEPGETI
ncbi:MAG: WD40 repeat domain-containing protein [bacterium]|nr:WD40 repeat domain-containing protein [bacterium]